MLIGRLADDLIIREVDIAELRQSFASLQGEVGVETKHVNQINEVIDIGEMVPQANLSEAPS